MEPIKEIERQDVVNETQEVEAKQEDLESVEYATINFAFSMSRHEAEEILKHPKGKVMKNFTAYMNKVVVSAAKKYSEIPIGETVTDCKVPIQ